MSVILVAMALAALTGCGFTGSATAAKTPVALRGTVHGGQKPVSSLSIQVYTADTSGRGSAAQPLLCNPVQSDSDGNFLIPASYRCPSATAQVYVVASGGNPGLPASVNNPALQLTTAVVPSIPASFFGLTVLNFENVSPTMPFGTARSWDAYPGLDWADSNPSLGVYNFTSLDDFMAANQARGTDIIYTFGRTPLWASSQPNAPGPYGPGQCAPPADMSAWDNYVRAIATHAAGRIKYWEIWNEPNGKQFYCGSIATMVALAQHAAEIIKKIDPLALILSPAVTAASGPAWLTSFLSQGGGSWVDVIAFHGYWSSHAEDVVNVISSYKALMAANGVAQKPTWDTESSWTEDSKITTLNTSEQAGFVAKDYLLHWSQGVSRFVWYAYDGGPIWGGLWNATTGGSVAAASYRETYRWMVGATLTAPCSVDRSGVWTCTLSRPGGYVAEAIWTSNATVTVAVPTQYLEYRDLAGGVHPIGNHRITIGDQPILLETATLP